MGGIKEEYVALEKPRMWIIPWGVAGMANETLKGIAIWYLTANYWNFSRYNMRELYNYEREQ